MTFLASPAARALLIGTGRHQPGSTLPDVPQVADTVGDLAQALITRAGLTADRLTTLIDPPGPQAVAEALREAAAGAEDVLFIHYAGHGVLSAAGELHLATQATRDITNGIATYQALPYRVVLDAIADCRARSVVLILDCCFSGRATPARVGDFFLLASATHDGVALAPEGARHTALSGELIRLLDEGEPTGPARLSLAYLHRQLDETLSPRYGIGPRVQITGRGGELVLAANPAYRHPARPEAVAAPPDSEAPYLGLRSYGPHNSGLFFGRRELTEELVRRVQRRVWQPGPLTVLGPSGSGKSSLLRAGLLPAIGQGALGVPRSASWPALVVTPGSAPLDVLLSALARLGRSEEPAERGQPTRDQLLADPRLLADAVRDALARSSRPAGADDRVVLVVDQFEELFTADVTERERAAFVAALCAAAAAGGPAIVVLGLRADFYGACARYPELAAALTEDHLLVGAMTDQQLREVVEGPARAAGIAVEPEFVEVLLQDIRQWDTTDTPPAVLPLLSHALLETWRRGDGLRLTAGAYVAAGRLGGAVLATADAVHDAMDDAERAELRRLLPRLVVLGQGRIYLRRRVERRQLVEHPAGPTTAVLDRLISARLLAADQDTVEITHDVLFQAWPLLRESVESAREDILTRQRLVEAAQLWADSEPHDPSMLYRGISLDAAATWAADPGHERELEPLAREFLTASTAAAEQTRRTERRRTRRARQAAAALAFLLLLATGAGGTAFAQWREAVQQGRSAMVTTVAEHSATELGDLGPEPMLLAGAAWRIGHSESARSSLLSTQPRPFEGAMLDTPTGLRPELTVDVSSDGRIIAAAGDDQRLRFWDRDSRKKLAEVKLAGQDEVTETQFSPVGRLLALTDGDSVQLWDATGFTLVAGLPVARVRHLAFNRAGTLLALGGDRSTEVWDIARRARVSTVDQGANGLQFAPDGSRLAIATGNGALLVDPGTGKPRGVVAQGTAVGTVAYSPDGSQLALGVKRVVEIRDPGTGEVLSSTEISQSDFAVGFYAPAHHLLLTSNGANIKLYDTADPRNPVDAGTLTATRSLTSFSLTPDGSTLVTASYGGAVELWRMPRTLSSTGLLAGIRPGNLVYDRTGDTVAVLTSQNTIEIVRPATGQVVATLPKADPRPLPADSLMPGTPHRTAAALSFSPDGSLLASYGADGTTRLWRAATGELVRELPAPSDADDSGPAMGSQFDPQDGRILAVAYRGRNTGTAGLVRLWDTSTGQPLGAFTTEGITVPLAFSPDGRTLATGESNGVVELWRVADKQWTGRLTVDGGDALGGLQLNALAFSPDGHLLAASGTLGAGPGGNPTTVWDLRGGGHHQEAVGGRTNNVLSVVFSPRGDLLAAVGLDGSVLLWDTKQHATLAILRTGPYYQLVLAARFAGDERTLTTIGTPSSANGDLLQQTWDLDPDLVLRKLCARLRTNLTPTQWSQADPSFPKVDTCPSR